MPKISEEKKLENMLEIQKNARQLFIQSGYNAVTVDDICKQTGISKGSFYTYFETKEDLFLAIAKESKSLKESFVNSLEIKSDSIESMTLMLWDMIFSDVTEADIINYRLTLEFWLESFENDNLRSVLEAKSKASLDVFKTLLIENLNLSKDDKRLQTWAIYFWAQAEGLMLYYTAHQRVPSVSEINEIRNIVKHFVAYMIQSKEHI